LKEIRPISPPANPEARGWRIGVMQHEFFSHHGPSTKATAVRLLQAAAEILGGEEQLAEHLGITESLLGRLMLGRYSVPDPLLLRAVDILLAHRESPIAAAARTPEFAGNT
jgi:hypothetical protein